MLALRVNNRHRNTGEKAERYEALLAVGKPVVFEGEGDALENPRSIDKVEAVAFRVCSTFRLRPSELHDQLYIQNVLASTEDLLLRSNA